MYVNAHARVWNSAERPGLPFDGKLTNNDSHNSGIMKLKLCRATIFKSEIGLTPATISLELRTEWRLVWAFIERFPR
jgi:hypothetical protein